MVMQPRPTDCSRMASGLAVSTSNAVPPLTGNVMSGGLPGNCKAHATGIAARAVQPERSSGTFSYRTSGIFPNRCASFADLCPRVPFHIATTLLRIVRIEWVTDDYRLLVLDRARDALVSVGG